MKFEATITKHGKHWIADAPGLRLMTQGTSEKKAHAMLKEIVEMALEDLGISGNVAVNKSKGKAAWEITCDSDAALISLMIRRQREAQGITLDEAAKRLGQTSKTAVSRYEQGTAEPTLSKLQDLLDVLAPGLSLKIG